MNRSATPPDRAEPTLNAPETKPPLGPSNLVTASIGRARTLLGQMAAQTPEEAAAHDRAMTGLDMLQRHLERATDPLERPSSAAVALAINLGGHPDPRQAHETHLVRPLLIAASSIPSVRGVRSWLDGLLRDANEAVLAEIQQHRADQGDQAP